ncbi:MAG: Rid family detoxifying hydrolase [Lactobacillus sp.]|jgi:2-iminobutanoate/2-iminopropanoate deaminase|nr:Rid family detoxifying hydrolase [Lactobacillus sp.]
MTIKPVNSQELPKPVGPYSHGVMAGDTLYISGQQGVDPKTGEMGADVSAQAVMALDNMGRVLDEAGLDYKHVVKTLIYLKNMADFSTINDIYARYFTELLPARSCVEVAKLPGNGLFEIEAVAVK